VAYFETLLQCSSEYIQGNNGNLASEQLVGVPVEIIPGLCHKCEAVVGKNSVSCWSVHLYGATVQRGPEPFPFRVTWTFRLLQMRGVCCLETTGTKYPVTQRHISEERIRFLGSCL
jgi:hypothetical protein